MRIIWLLLLMLVPCPAFGQPTGGAITAPELKIRAFFEPEGDIYVGQLVRLWVEIFSSSGFSKAPQYSELQLNGAIALLPDQFGVNTTTKIAGKTWVGQRQRYAIIPQRGGRFVIPPIKVIVGVKNGSEASNPVTLQTQPFELTAIFPPGMQDVKQILTTNTVSIEEAYDRETAGLQVGDAITRTVTLRGGNTFALALPAISFEQVKGTRIYSSQPVLSDKTDRGKYAGTRIDSATYVLEQAGDVVLPEIKISWWDPDSQSKEEVVLPSVEFQVAINPDFHAPADNSLEVQSWTEKLKQNAALVAAWFWNNIVWLSMAVFGLYTMRMVWRHYGAVVIESWSRWHRRRSVSESHFFNEFRQACSSGNETAMAHSFWRWVDSLSPDTTTTPTLSEVGLKEHGKWANDFFKQMERSRYGLELNQDIDGQKFYQAMKIHRRAIHRDRSSGVTTASTQLNPRENRC